MRGRGQLGTLGVGKGSGWAAPVQGCVPSVGGSASLPLPTAPVGRPGAAALGEAVTPERGRMESSRRGRQK